MEQGVALNAAPFATPRSSWNFGEQAAFLRTPDSAPKYLYIQPGSPLPRPRR